MFNEMAFIHATIISLFAISSYTVLHIIALYEQMALNEETHLRGAVVVELHRHGRVLKSNYRLNPA